MQLNLERNGFVFQITLRMARELNGYTLEEAAEYFGMTTDIYGKIENDPSQILLSLIHKIVIFYGVPMSLIYPGTEAACIKHNQKFCAWQG